MYTEQPHEACRGDQRSITGMTDIKNFIDLHYSYRSWHTYCSVLLPIDSLDCNRTNWEGKVCRYLAP